MLAPRLFALALSVFLTGEATAQVNSCIKDHVSNIKPATNSTGISSKDVKTLVDKISEAISFSQEVIVVPCHYAKKVDATHPIGLEGVPSQDYIVYNPQWLREVIGTDRVQAIALFGHELGHFVNRHFESRSSLPRVDKEREADVFAGCAIARMGESFATLQNLLERLRSDKQSDYPDRLTSITSARHGFQTCGGQATLKFDIANTYEHGVQQINAGNFTSAFSTFTALANTGDPRAQFQLGKLYYVGAGTEKDLNKSFFWLKKSADQGLRDAQHNLGVLYQNGQGTQKDSAQAIFWFTQGARNGFQPSQQLLDQQGTTW